MCKKEILLDAKMLCNGINNLLLSIEDKDNNADYLAKSYLKNELHDKINALKRKVSLI